MPKVQLNHWYKKIGGPGEIVDVSDVEADRIVKGKGGTIVAEASPAKPVDPEPTPEQDAEPPVEPNPEGSDESEGEEAPAEPTPDPEPEKPKRSRKK